MSDDNSEPTHQDLVSRKEQLIKEVMSNMVHSNISSLVSVFCFGASLWDSDKWWYLTILGWLFILLNVSYWYEFKKLSKELTEVKSKLGEGNDNN